MTTLRKRMIEDLQLKSTGERTQEMYVRAARLSKRTLTLLPEHFHSQMIHGD
jgi:hypothetical protein